MLAGGVDFQFFHLVTGQVRFVRHAPDGQTDDFLGVPIAHFFRGRDLEAAHVIGVTVVEFLFPLGAGENYFIGIQDDHEIAGIGVTGVGRLVFADHHLRDHRSNATHHLVFRIHHVPLGGVRTFRLEVMRANLLRLVRLLLQHRRSGLQEHLIEVKLFLPYDFNHMNDTPKWTRPLNPLENPRFGGLATFNRLPYLPDIKGKNVDVAILGIPYDGGTSFRPGARFAPRAVRDASVLNRNYNPHTGSAVFEKLNVVDAGDVAVNPIQIQKTFQAIEARVTELQNEGARTVCIGGDHSVVLAELRAAHKKYGALTVIHFDAHTDTGDQAWGEKYHHGTIFRRALEEGLIAKDSLFQIGIRGPLTSAAPDDFAAAHGIRVLDIDQLQDSKQADAFFAAIHATGKGKPCFITFDVDGIDPAFAPGTGTPVVGGMTSREALGFVRRLKGLHIVGADVVEISPPYDQSDLTALLGAALMFEFLSLMSEVR